ncbi:MAG: family efflux transporter [Candidatus Hydrogenedentes bacterium]|nr:family efflux transporter [Candidatus Hydrogenedentota bacterium]
MTASEHTSPRWDGLREVMGMSGPIILGTMSYTMMQFVDMLMVSRLGTDTLAAAGSAGVWSYTMGCLIYGTVGCVSTFVGQSFGRGNFEHCARYAWQGIYASFLAAILALALWPLSGALFGLMQHTPEVTRLELLFFRVRLTSYVSMAWVIALSSFFQAVNRPRIPMYSAILGNVVNIVFNFLLIYGLCGFPRWGIAGSAAATSIALAVQTVVLQAVFMSKPFHEQFKTRTVWRIDPMRIRELLRIGLPSGLTIFMDVANWGIFTSFVVGRFGSTQLAAHTAAMNFMHLCFMPVLGLSQGVTALVGQYVGARDIRKAKARTYTAMRIAIIYMFLMGLTFAIFGKQLVHMTFSKEVEVIALAHILLILSAVFQGFDSNNSVSIGGLRGAGDTRWMAVIFSIGAYGVFLPLSYTLGYVAGWGAVGAWIGATIYIIGLSGVLFRRFHGERWQHIRIFSEDR